MTKTVCLNEYIVSVQYHIYLIGTLGFFISDRQMSIIVVKTYALTESMYSINKKCIVHKWQYTVINKRYSEIFFPQDTAVQNGIIL